MPTDISPDKQTINDVFGATNYHIDFYQRDYKWQSEQVQTLLDDLFHVFTPAYANFQEREPNSETINEFPWYYLSTYVTSDAGGKTYVVDGQQRLTTLTLMLIRLYKLAEHRDMDDMAKCVEEKILGHTLDGKNYYIGHGKREEPLRAIFENEGEDLNVGHDVTAKNMLKNYGLIQAELDERLSDPHSLQMFIRFLLQRVVLIQLSVKQRTDVPMVFEVINDRGVSLNPHEILKGKLLSRIDRKEVEPFVHTWEAHVGALDYADMADEFFETYLRSRFAETRDEGQRFRGNYHRLMFEPEYGSELNLTETANAKDFVCAEVPYFSGLYQELHDLADKFHATFPHVRYNDLTGMDSQYMLVLAACSRNDAQKEKKIRVVSRELDRLYVLLQLNKAYDSNTFADSMYGIRTELAESDTEGYRAIFDQRLFSQVEESRDIRIDDPLPYRFFRQVGYEDLNQRILRYFFARVEEFIADGIGKNLPDKRYNLVRNSGSKNGYHIEHILAHNDENLANFDNEEERFERERHRLGGLLLLNNRDNLSSGNEPYRSKKDTYVTTLYWNQTLRDDFAKSKPNHRDFIQDHDLDIHGIDVFDEEALEQRTKVLYKIARELWC